MTLRLPRLRGDLAIVSGGGKPALAFIRSHNDALGQIETLLNQITAIPAIQTALAGLDAATAAANDAATAAQTAADSAQSAADTANATVAQIEAGTLDLTAVKVGGTRFINTGGSLVAEP